MADKVTKKGEGSDAPSVSESLFDELGGSAAVDAAAEEFYKRVLDDEELKPFFQATDLDWLKGQQKKFLTQAFGGPSVYDGQDMKAAHAHLPIEGRHFARVAEHLVATLQSLGVQSLQIAGVVSLLAPLESEVVNTFLPEETPEDGGGNAKMDNGSSGSDAAAVATPSAGVSVADAMARQMIENAPINIMMADKNRKLVYMNPASRKTLKTVEQYLPVKVDQMLGQSIDVFHKDPSYQKGILANPDANLPRSAIIQLGPERLDLLVSSIHDESGGYQGAMVTWSVVTAKLKAETEMIRLQQMVENAPINIMMADKDLNLVYMNPASAKTLKTVEQYLPIKVDQMIGQNIDIFHKDPSCQREILGNPDKNLPRSAIIQLGPEQLDLLVSPISDSSGEYMGAMATWSVVTQKLKAEAEMIRLQQMVENAPINIMMADKDRNLVYMNPASAKTLKTIEQYLPVKVEQLVGQNIDVFHKDPSYQKGILADPDKNLPRSAIIQLGPEQLDLLVAPISDSNGEYLGAMATWSVVTEKLRAEQREKEMIEQITNCSTQLGSASSTLKTVSQKMATEAEQTASQAETASAASEQVSSSTATVATATEEMTASIKEIAGNASQASKVAGGAVEVANQANENIAKLGDSSDEIGKVIKVISSIAEQTNLLALNATIEAARAGEAGKGFAVVANEVKELAKETARATEDITQKIETIQTDTSVAVKAIAEITDTIQKINDISNSIASAVEEQTATTNEIARTVNEAAKGATDISENIGMVAEAAKNTKEGANQALNSAEELSGLSTTLQELVDRIQNR